MNDARKALKKFKENVTENNLVSNEPSTTNKSDEDYKKIVDFYEKLVSRLETLQKDSPQKGDQIDRLLKKIEGNLKKLSDLDSFDASILNTEDYQQMLRDVDRLESPEKNNDEANIDKEKVVLNTQEQMVEDLASKDAADMVENQSLKTQEQMVEDLASKNAADSDQKQTSNNEPKKGSEDAYISMLSDRIAEIERKLESLRKREKLDITGHTTINIMGYELELMDLKEKQKSYKNRTELDYKSETKLSDLDLAHERLDQANKESKMQIEKLKAMRETLKSRREVKKVDREIKRLKKFNDLYMARKMELHNKQKAIMYPKYKAEMKRVKRDAKRMAPIATYDEKIRVNNELQAMLDRDNNLIDRLRGSYYDYKGNRYKKKLAEAYEKLEKMKMADAQITNKGKNTTSLRNKVVEKFRNNMQSQAMNQAAPQITA